MGKLYLRMLCRLFNKGRVDSGYNWRILGKGGSRLIEEAPFSLGYAKGLAEPQVCGSASSFFCQGLLCFFDATLRI